MDAAAQKPVIQTTAQPAQQVVISVAPVEQPVPETPPSVDQATEDATNDRANIIPQDNYLTSPLFHEICTFFNVEPQQYEIAKDKLSVITDYVITQKNSNKLEDILIGIREVENKLQPPAWGETRYNNIYKYLRLASQRDSFNKALSAFERSDNRVQ